MSEDSKDPIRQVQCTSNEQAFDEVAAGIPGLTNPMEASIGIWEKMVASREPDNPLSMHSPTAMRFVVMGNKSNMTKFNMTNHVEVLQHRTKASWMQLTRQRTKKHPINLP